MAARSKSQRRYDRYSDMRGQLIDIIRKHIQYKSPHADMLQEENSRIFHTKAYCSLTISQCDCLREVQRCWHDRIYELHLDWRLGTVDGPVSEASTNDHDWSTGRLSELSRTPGALYGAHYWKGSDRLYGEWKPIN